MVVSLLRYPPPFSKGNSASTGNLAVIDDSWGQGFPAQRARQPRPCGAFCTHPSPIIPQNRVKPQLGKSWFWGSVFPWPVAQIVLQHHERLDNSGYPQGLSGEEILLEARSLAVADVVEAMSSLRPYRPALGLQLHRTQKLSRSPELLLSEWIA